MIIAFQHYSSHFSNSFEYHITHLSSTLLSAAIFFIHDFVTYIFCESTMYWCCARARFLKTGVHTYASHMLLTLSTVITVNSRSFFLVLKVWAPFPSPSAFLLVRGIACFEWYSFWWKKVESEKFVGKWNYIWQSGIL